MFAGFTAAHKLEFASTAVLAAQCGFHGYLACGDHADERPSVAAFRGWLREEAARLTA